VTELLRLIAVSAAGAVAVACGAEPWVVASERVPQVDDSLPPRMRTVAGGPPDCADTAALLSERRIWSSESMVLDGEHVGVWAGELSGSGAPDFPGTRATLELRSDFTGSFWIEGPAPPAPDDGERSYLCDGSVSGGVCGSVSGYVAGFAYPLERVMSRGQILSFSIVDTDPWELWCNLQAPFTRAEPFIACGVAFDAVPPNSERWAPEGCELALDSGNEPIDCGVMYSLARCQCARNGCIASFMSRIEVGLRLSEDGGELSGSLWFKDETDAATLRLSRQ